MYEVFREKFRVPGGGPDQLNCCKEAAAGSLLTCSLDIENHFILSLKSVLDGDSQCQGIQT